MPQHIGAPVEGQRTARCDTLAPSVLLDAENKLGGLRCQHRAFSA
jgi:hypothetical protein